LTNVDHFGDVNVNLLTALTAFGRADVSREKRIAGAFLIVLRPISSWTMRTPEPAGETLAHSRPLSRRLMS
jgi:hypothetical protein